MSAENKEKVNPEKTPPPHQSGAGPDKRQGWRRFVIVLVCLNILLLAMVLWNRGLSKITSSVQPDYAILNDVLFEDETDDSVVSNENVNTNTAPKNTNTALKNTNTAPKNTNTAKETTSYTSTGLGLSFNLPEIFTVAEDVKPADDFFQATTYDEQALTEEKSPAGLKIEIYLEKNPEETTLLEWAANRDFSDEPEVTFQNRKTGGKDGLVYEELTGSAGSYSLYVASAKNYYAIYISGDRTSYDRQGEAIQEFVDSIKFISTK